MRYRKVKAMSRIIGYVIAGATIAAYTVLTLTVYSINTTYAVIFALSALPVFLTIVVDIISSARKFSLSHRKEAEIKKLQKHIDVLIKNLKGVKHDN